METQTSHSLNLVFLGLSITSSWGNGHATTYRALIRALNERGHRVTFLERDVPWYAANRDMPEPPFCILHLYDDLPALKRRFEGLIRCADAVIVGSYVPEGVPVGEWITQTAMGVAAFYDIDTPVTLAKLRRKDYEYIAPHLIPRYDLYLSFTGGPTLDLLQNRYGSPAARPLYCSVDPDHYYPEEGEMRWDLGYMGTYSDDRQPVVDRLLIQPARLRPQGRFVVAGPSYPETIQWPDNVERIEHLPPRHHRQFYNSQRFTLNVTRADMVEAGFAPSVRLFEAAACATPIISDYWDGLDTFFAIGSELLVARSAQESLQYLYDLPESERRRIGERARRKVLNNHTAAHRAQELERFLAERSGQKVRTPMSTFERV